MPKKFQTAIDRILRAIEAILVAATFLVMKARERNKPDVWRGL